MVIFIKHLEQCFECQSTEEKFAIQNTGNTEPRTLKHSKYCTKVCCYFISNNNNKEYVWDFPGGTVIKNSPANAGDMGSSPGRRSQEDPTCRGATKPMCHNY